MADKLFQKCVETLTPIQRKIHAIDDIPKTDKDGNEIDIDVRNELNDVFNHVSYTLPFSEEMQTKVSQSDSIIYKINTSHSKLQAIVYDQWLPEIKVLPEFQEYIEVAWPRNIGYNTIEEARLRIDDIPFMTRDPIWMDKYFQETVDTLQDIKHNLTVGNVTILNNWTTVLPKYNTAVVLPFFTRVNKSFPLFFIGNNSTMDCEIKSRNTIHQLLRMRETRCCVHGLDHVTKCKHEGCELEYKEMKANPTFLSVSGVTNTNGQDPVMPMPRLFGYYNRLTNTEIDYYKCESSGMNVYYYEDVIMEETLNPHKFKTVADVPFSLADKALSIIGLYWTAQSVQSLESNNYSNYTTNPSEPCAGFSPISKSQLMMGHTKVFELSSLHTEKLIPMIKGVKGHVESGYHMWLAPPTVDTKFNKSSYPPASYRLTVTLDDTSPLKDGQLNSTFKVICHALVQREIQFVVSSSKSQRCHFLLDGDEEHF